MITAEAFILLVFKIAGSIALTSFFVGVCAIAVYYSVVMAYTVIKGRERYIKRLKKSNAFNMFNEGRKLEGKKLEVVKKKEAKVK